MQALRVIEEDSYEIEQLQRVELRSSSYPNLPARIIEKIWGKHQLDSPFPSAIEDDFWTLGGADSSSTSLGFVLAGKADSTNESEMSSSEQIRLVVHTLGFSKRQLGDLFGVSRQAIYDWLKGETVSERNASRLSELARMLVPIWVDIRRPLYHRYTTEPISANNPSILELLREENWNTERIKSLLRMAGEMTVKRLERSGANRSQVSKSQGDENFLSNMRSLGEG